MCGVLNLAFTINMIMTFFKHLYFAAALFRFVTCLCDSFTGLNAENLVFKNKALDNEHFWVGITTAGIGECAQLCVRRKPCVSFNYDLEDGICELNSVVISKDSVLRIGHSLMYSEIVNWPSKVKGRNSRIFYSLF